MNTATPKTDRWIVKHQANSLARLRLFCFPIAGGNASAFQSWADQLPEHIEVCAIQLPGRQQRMAEPPYKRMPLVIQALERAIHPHLDLPFAIFGTCTGTLVGYELVQRLAWVAGVQPVHFLASCCRAPHLPDRDQPIHGLPENEMWAELERLGGTPPIISHHPALKSMLSPILRADFELAETYHYREAPSLNCPITVFGGIHDTVVSPDELAAWRTHTTAGFEVRMLGGGHYLLDSAGEELLLNIAQVLS